jgi:hypothetical protein
MDTRIFFLRKQKSIIYISTVVQFTHEIPWQNEPNTNSLNYTVSQKIKPLIYIISIEEGYLFVFREENLKVMDS